MYCTPDGATLANIPLEPDADDFAMTKEEPTKALEALEESAAAEERILETIPDEGEIGGIFLDCPQTLNFVYTDHALVKRCPPANFKKYVNDAETAAKLYYEQFQCLRLSGDCNRTTTIVRREWDCIVHAFPIPLFHEVVIKLYIQIRCQPI